MDSNNYLDVRNETHFEDQGTVRVDHNFSNDDTLLARYSLGTQHGFSPSSGVTATTENLPGFGANFDNLSQQAVISWNHVFSSTRLNTASIAVSRLSMDRTSQNDNVNDIVGQLGIQGIGFGGPGAWGAPWFAAQGYTGIGDTFAATPMHAWDTTHRTPRQLTLAARTPWIQIWRRLPPVHLADVGILPEPRLLSVHQRLHHAIRIQRWQRFRIRQSSA